MKNEPLISVITVCYNAYNTIESTILSVIKQTSTNFEYIIIDGDSKDDTLSIIKKYDNNIDYWISESDTGIYNAMNKGVKKSHGNYCIFMNAGDTFANRNVLQNIEIFLNNKYDVITGNEIYIRNNKIVDYVKSPQELTFNRLYTWSIAHQASFIKTSLLKEFPYDEELRMVSDWKFWIETIILNNKIYKSIDLNISCFNLEGITNTNKLNGRAERGKVLNELIPRAILKDYNKFNKTTFIEKLLKRIKKKVIRTVLLFLYKKEFKKDLLFCK